MTEAIDVFKYESWALGGRIQGESWEYPYTIHAPATKDEYKNDILEWTEGTKCSLQVRLE